MASINLKQITDNDIKNLSVVQKSTLHGNICNYAILTQSILKGEISKLGYCCEPKGLDYPIFLTMNGIEKRFEVGKTGMFEVQPETFTDVNDETLTEEKTATVNITEIKVPLGISFTLDYIIAVS